jgi:hypothetical protein
VSESKTVFTFADGSVGPGRWDSERGEVVPTAPLPDEELAAILNGLPRTVCYRTHTQWDEGQGVFGAVWIADVQRALTPLLAALRAERAARERVLDDLSRLADQWEADRGLTRDEAVSDLRHAVAALAPATGEGATDD